MRFITQKEWACWEGTLGSGAGIVHAIFSNGEPVPFSWDVLTHTLRIPSIDEIKPLCEIRWVEIDVAHEHRAWCLLYESELARLKALR